VIIGNILDLEYSLSSLYYILANPLNFIKKKMTLAELPEKDISKIIKK